ncbi:MAG: hypothetical protein EPN60_07505, partial [Nevskiaceae bacterium]
MNLAPNTTASGPVSALNPAPAARWLEGPVELAPLLLRAGELRPLLAVGAAGGAARNSLLLH